MSSSNGTTPGNRAATASLVLALLALAAIPIGVAISGWRDDLRLVHAGFAVPVAALLAIAAIRLARRARHRLERTLGRAGGVARARAGRIVGWLALYVALIGGISLGVYALEYFVLG
jgi:hypothetical protein